MFTLCPHCDSVHGIDAATLSTARGTVVCASCTQSFDALGALYDDYPDRGKPPPKAVSAEALKPPVIGAAPVAATPLPPASVAKKGWGSGLWVLVLTLLLLATLFNAAWVFRDELPPDSALVHWLQEQNVPGFEPAPDFRDPSLIHLVTRDIHSHPTRAGVLVLSATFINLAEQAQPYPTLLVTLSDSDNRPLAARSFEPHQYLSSSTTDPGLLQPDQNVPLLLEFADPGEKASGFNLEFY